MQKGNRWLGLLFVAAMTLAITGCPKEKPAAPTGGQTGGTGSSTPDSGRKKRIAVIPKGTAHSFWQTVLAGAQAAGQEENVEIIWQGPSGETDITGQINLVQNQINAGVDGIVLAATDAKSLLKPVQDAMSKNIPVVTIDSGLSEPISLSYIATNNVEGGRQAADALAKAIGEKGKVGLLIFLKGARSSDEREQGFIEGLRKYPNIQLVSTLDIQSDPQKALEMTLNMLNAHPDLVGIFAANEPGGVGAANALRQRKLTDKVKLVAFDASEDQIKSLNEGVIQALVVQDPFKMGYLGVKTVMKAIRKETLSEKFIDSGVVVVNKENINTEPIQKLLYPQGKK
jgi:ribose transport system substrate-binding protein